MFTLYTRLTYQTVLCSTWQRHMCTVNNFFTLFTVDSEDECGKTSPSTVRSSTNIHLWQFIKVKTMSNVVISQL